MQPVNLLVVSKPGVKHLSVLETLPPETKVTISDDPEVLAKAAPDTDVVLNCTGKGEPLRIILSRAARLKWIHSLATGVEDQLIPEVTGSQIPLTNSRGVFRESLGEFVIAAALFFAKDLRRMLKSQAAHKWDPFDVEEISRQSMGVVGYGEIGRAAARRGKAMGMRILATRRTGEPDPEGIADAIFPLERRGDMLAESDVVLVAAPLTPGTRSLVGEAEIRRMKPTAILINVGRGPVVDEQALVRALQENRIRGAALDVFDKEPLPEQHPFWTLENVLISPHCADHTDGWLESAVQFFVGNFQRFIAGQQLLNLVDKTAGY